jgi:capsular exopolysaccharide synthesis family protein
VLSAGDIPIQPYKDPRKPAAAGLGLAGLMLPILAFLLIGLADHRFRFSDQADDETGGAGLPPLLGILPTLPDRLNDPEPAAVAAHCVHQLRIMLQVGTAHGAGADGQPVSQRKAYVITSASPGDGKTSLTMALGLSFAASGSRTLVIDCDMVGQGLTNRLKAGGSQGLLEALQAGTLAGRVKKTTTPNLYVLPIGQAESAHAGALSPQSVRRLLVEARKIFDVVVIDTGPILGSLEAQVLSAAADSVILTVARGQQQPLLQKALRMLRQIGAHVAGMVFNRAQQKDFEKSVTSSSIKSVSHATPTRRELLEEGAEGSRFGPLARSVASFLPTNRDIPVPPPKTVKPVASTTATAADEIRVEVVSHPAPAADDTVYGENGDGNGDGHGNGNGQ